MTTFADFAITGADLIAPYDLAETDRETWLELRRSGVGGSDIGAIAGFNRYTTPYRVWLEKTGQAPEVRDPELDRKAYIGSRAEAFIASLFAEETGLGVHRIGMLRRRDLPWMLVNLDRQVTGCPDGPCILEIKNRSQYRASEWDAGVPDDTECQAHWGIGVTDYSHGHAAVLIGGNEFRHYRIERDEDILNGLIAIGSKFWDMVTTRTAPPIGPTQADAELLAALFADAVPDLEVAVDAGEAQRWMAQRAAAKDAIDLAEAQATEAENRLKLMLGNGTVALVDGKPAYTWKPVPARRVDAKRLKVEQPDIYARYAVAKNPPARRLNILKGDER